MIDSAVTFEVDATGAAPMGWTATKTGKGNAIWTVEQDPTAPSKRKIVRQSGQATYPLLLKDGSNVRDGFIAIKFKAVAGSRDRAAGVVWLARDDQSYYIAPATAL